MPTGKVFGKMTLRRCSGIARRQNKGLQKHNINWVWRIPTDEESVKTLYRQCSGIARQQNKVMPMPKIIWV